MRDKSSSSSYLGNPSRGTMKYKSYIYQRVLSLVDMNISVLENNILKSAKRQGILFRRGDKGRSSVLAEIDGDF